MNSIKSNFTIGIPTRSPDNSLVNVSESINKSTNLDNIKILVVSDTKKRVESQVMSALKNNGVEVDFIPGENTQTKKMNIIFKKINSEIIVLTQDDVQFSPSALDGILEIFRNSPEITMVGADVLSFSKVSLLNNILEIGLRIVRHVGTEFRGGDNYLMANGRCMALRKSIYKKIVFPDVLINADAYLYFQNKKLGGKFKFAKDAVVYNSSPRVISKQVSQTERFLFSKTELSKYFDAIESEYQIPFKLLIKGLVLEFLRAPFYCILYLVIRCVSYIKYYFFPNKLTPFWNNSSKIINP